MGRPCRRPPPSPGGEPTWGRCCNRRAGDEAMSESARRQVAGRGIPVPGNDIDTDRIIPARFLKTVTNEGLGLPAFEDARKHDPEHPFTQKAYEGASVRVAGGTFGSRSSREHAPASLK